MGLGLTEKIKLTFLRPFDNSLSNYLIFKRIFLHAMANLGYLSKLKRGLVLAFGAHFLHDSFIKVFLISYSISGQGFNVIPFLLLKISNKMYYEAII